MPLSLIYARSLNHCIGKAGRIPWHLPDEFAHFKKTTMGKPIIMGRKTYEDHCSALPGRLNIVVSRQPGYQAVEGIVVVNSLQDALQLAYENSDEIFIIGGSSFFSECFASANCIYETVVQADIDGDAFLPEFDFSDWSTELIAEHGQDSRHMYAYKVYVHRRG